MCYIIVVEAHGRCDRTASKPMEDRLMGQCFICDVCIPDGVLKCECCQEELERVLDNSQPETVSTNV